MAIHLQFEHIVTQKSDSEDELELHILTKKMILPMKHEFILPRITESKINREIYGSKYFKSKLKHKIFEYRTFRNFIRQIFHSATHQSEKNSFSKNTIRQLTKGKKLFGN